MTPQPVPVGCWWNWTLLCCVERKYDPSTSPSRLLMKLNLSVLCQQKAWHLSQSHWAVDETLPFCVVSTESMTPQLVPAGFWWNWSFPCCVNREHDTSASPSGLLMKFYLSVLCQQKVWPSASPSGLLMNLNRSVLCQQKVWPPSQFQQVIDETEPFCVVSTESMTPQPVPAGCWWNWTLLCCVNRKYDPSASSSRLLMKLNPSVLCQQKVWPRSQPQQAVDKLNPSVPVSVGCWWNWSFLCCVNRKYDPWTSPSRLLMTLNRSVLCQQKVWPLCQSQNPSVCCINRKYDLSTNPSRLLMKLFLCCVNRKYDLSASPSGRQGDGLAHPIRQVQCQTL